MVSPPMAWVCYLLLFAVDLIGLLLAAFTLPGLWLMLAAAAVFALLTRGQFLGWKTLLVLLLIAAGSEVSDIVLGGAGAKKAGASKWGMVGGFVGAILGGIFLTGFIPVPILSTVIGLCLGSFIGAFSVELLLGQSVVPSLRIGLGAAKGKLYGIVGKLVLGMLMLGISLWTALPVHGRWAHHPHALPNHTTTPRAKPTTVAAPASRP